MFELFVRQLSLIKRESPFIDGIAQARAVAARALLGAFAGILVSVRLLPSCTWESGWLQLSLGSGFVA